MWSFSSTFFTALVLQIYHCGTLLLAIVLLLGLLMVEQKSIPVLLHNSMFLVELVALMFPRPLP